MEQQFCGSCAFFQQHYALNRNKLFRVYCGRCLLTRPKRKVADAKACSEYQTCEPDISAFASKEYLSKELLRYVLSLPLLPEIEDE